MKKDYLILWFDDDKSSIETDIEKIKHHLMSYGVNPMISYYDPVGKIDTILDEDEVKSKLDNPELDMILMDYDLSLGETGAKLIKYLRNKNIYIPIIFYSEKDFDSIIKSLSADALEGVFISKRDDLENKAKKILDSLLEKEHKVLRIRGLLLNDTSEIDARGEKIAINLWEKLDTKKQEEILVKLKRHMIKSNNSRGRKIENLDASNFKISSLWIDKLFDAEKRGFLLNHIFKELGMVEYSNTITDLCYRAGSEALFGKRNNFAHKTQEDLETIYDRGFAKEIRIELRDKIEKLEELEKKLGII